MAHELQTVPVSKVLVLDHMGQHTGALKQFFEKNNLLALRTNRSQPDVLALLNTNVDLGAIIIADDFCGHWANTRMLAETIHAIRPELPIALRVAADQLHVMREAELPGCFCIAFSVETLALLEQALNRYIFSMAYPNELVRGIAESGVATLAGQFPRCEVQLDTPYLVRDRIIYGEIFSLMPLESSWCRGYMMLQAEEASILETWGIAKDDRASAQPMDFRAVNHLLGEITNLMWGAFKSRFIGDDSERAGSLTQIPIVTNHVRRYISFGSENPQLCFKYRLTDKTGQRSFYINQWFIFNLAWAPENFREQPASVAELVDSGELEFF